MPPLSLYRRLTLAALAITLCTFAVSGAFATAIPTGDGGILNVSSAALPLGVTLVGGSTYCFNFSGGNTCAATPNAMSVSGMSTDFSTASGSTIKNFTTAPVPGFESVVGGTGVGGLTVNFDLTSLVVGAGTLANCSSNTLLNVCTPSGSPFNIIQTSATGVSITFDLLLNAYTGTSASGVTPYIGIFSTQISGTLSGTGACSGGLTASVTNIFTCVGGGGTLVTTWSASEQPTQASSTPEPGTVLLMGSGLAGLAGYIRRFKRS